MPGWGWVIVAVAVVAVIGVVVWQATDRRRSERLRGRFGSEYDRAVGSADSKRDAERELRAREERRSGLDVRPLSPDARNRYLANWQAVQAQFVDEPRDAVRSADMLIQSVMRERGYPVEDFEQRAADVSVDHADVVENYREGHRLSTADGTEDLRRAMQHYRALFDDLLETDASAPTTRGRDDVEEPASARRDPQAERTR